MRGKITHGLKTLLLFLGVIGLFSAMGCEPKPSANEMAKDQKIRELELALAQKNSQDELYRANLAEKDRLLKELQDKYDSEKGKVKVAENKNKELEDRAKALRDRLSKNIGVIIDNGVVKLVLQNKILFDSGRTELKDEGKKALLEVAKLLNKSEYNDLAIRVEGHTDSDKIKSTLTHKFPTNWELSTTRATTVVRYLIGDGKMVSERLYAAGYGEFHPVATNSTTAGKQLNRRVEIALLPKEWGFVKKETDKPKSIKELTGEEEDEGEDNGDGEDDEEVIEIKPDSSKKSSKPVSKARLVQPVEEEEEGGE